MKNLKSLQNSRPIAASRVRARPPLPLAFCGVVLLLSTGYATSTEAHVAHSGGGAQQQTTTQGNAGAQPVRLRPGAAGAAKQKFIYKAREGSKAVSLAGMGPPANVHLEASWAILSWLELGARLSVASGNFDAGAGRAMSSFERSTGVFARWLPMPLHSPYVDVGLGVVSERVRGEDKTSLGYGNALSYARDRIFPSVYAGAGYAFRPGAGIIFSAGFGVRSHLGAPGNSAFTLKGSVTDDDAQEVVAKMDKAAQANDGLVFYGEASIGYAF